MWSLKYQLALLASLVAVYIVAFILLRGETVEVKRKVYPQNHYEYGHILTLTYMGQQVAGIRGVLSQQCWAKDFNLPMKMVSPFIENSQLQHSEDIWRRHGAVSTFADFYDISHFNKEAESTGGPSLVSWESFLEKSSKSMIVVNVLKLQEKGCLVFNSVSMCSGKNSRADLLLSECEISQQTKTDLQHLKELGYEVKRSICLDCKLGIEKNFTPQEILDTIFGDHQPHDVTLVFNTWRYTIRMSPTCSNSCPKNALEKTIRPSKSLGSKVSSYHNTLRKALSSSSSALTVGIMIRVEWLLIYLANHSNKGDATPAQEVENCLKEVIEKYNHLKDPRGEGKVTGKLPIIAMDIGKYGSSTFQQTMRLNKIKQKDFDEVESKLKYFVSEVYAKKMTFEEWEGTYTSVAEEAQGDKGYIAYLQNTLMSETADCLILMGGGHFQKIALDHYLLTHSGNKRCIHQVCSSNAFAVQQ